jgi:propanol-preferring alcohol dehydrogenase
MLLEKPGQPLRAGEVPRPEPGREQILVRVHACGVCRTDLHIAAGELAAPSLPLIPGHEIVGTVAGAGDGARGFTLGDRVGIPWLGWTCGVCEFCRSGRENLCDRARFTGYHLPGGYAEYVVCDAR